MEIENGTSPNTDVAIYSGLLVAPERIDNYVFTERLTRFLLCQWSIETTSSIYNVLLMIIIIWQSKTNCWNSKNESLL